MLRRITYNILLWLYVIIVKEIEKQNKSKYIYNGNTLHRSQRNKSVCFEVSEYRKFFDKLE